LLKRYEESEKKDPAYYLTIINNKVNNWTINNSLTIKPNTYEWNTNH
jgi:hypothetical protein